MQNATGKCCFREYSNRNKSKYRGDCVKTIAALHIFTSLALHLPTQIIWDRQTAKIVCLSHSLFFHVLPSLLSSLRCPSLMALSYFVFYFPPLLCHLKDKKVATLSSLCVSCSWKQHYPKFPCQTSILQRRKRVACHSQTTSFGSSMLVPVRHAWQTGNRGQMLCWSVLKMTPSCCSQIITLFSEGCSAI